MTLRYQLPDHARDDLVAAHRALPVSGDLDAFTRDAHHFGCKHFPREMLDLLWSLSEDADGPGLAIIENLPIGEPGDTPTSDKEYYSRGGRDRFSERILMAVGEQLGTIYAYRNERNGYLVSNVVPTEGDREVQSSNGSALELPLHTEDVHQHPYSPDFVILFCLRDEPGQHAFTHILESRPVVERLPPTIRQTLEQPLFVSEPPPIYAGRNNRTPKPLPVLEGARPHKLQVEFNDTRALGADAQRALEELKRECARADTLIRIDLRPGQAAILNNNKVLHGRGPFTSSFGVKRRWLQRVKVKAGTLWPWRELIHDHRVIDL